MILRWVAAIFFAVAVLGSVSCAPAQNYSSLFQSGYTECQGALGNFNITLTADGSGQYQLTIQLIDVTSPGTLVTVALANGNGGQPQYLIPEIQLERGATLNAGELTHEQATLYPVVVILPFSGNSDPNFLNNNAANGNECQLPTQDSSSGQPF